MMQYEHFCIFRDSSINPRRSLNTLEGITVLSKRILVIHEEKIRSEGIRNSCFR
jgi:hypothetical protein